MMDKSRGATQIDPLLIVQPANIEGRASAFGRLIDDPDAAWKNGRALTSNAVRH